MAEDGPKVGEPVTEEQVRAFLREYAWMPDTPEQVQAEIDCIMHQDDWKYVTTLADRYADAQFEPGPKAFSEGMGFALSALYECHDGPHIPTCPRRRDDVPCIHPGVFARVGSTHEHCWTCDRDIPVTEL